MSNTTSKVITTKAGEALIAKMQAENKVLVIDKFVFANVPNRPDFPQREDIVPTADVVHESAVHEQGRLTENSVIYSTTLASDIGPFTFNWSGLYCSEYNTLVAINYPPAIDKTADGPGVTGNTLVRSFVLEYKGIAETTNITVDPESWQYNAHKRMGKMDNDTSQAIIDQNGKDWFIEDGFIVTPQSTAYNIKAGAGYVSGNRIALEFDRIVQVPDKPSFIYVDAWREGTPTGEWLTKFNFVVSADEKDDYTDAQDVNHFVCKIAQVLADGSVSDLRLEASALNKEHLKYSGDLKYWGVSSINHPQANVLAINKAFSEMNSVYYTDGDLPIDGELVVSKKIDLKGGQIIQASPEKASVTVRIVGNGALFNGDIFSDSSDNAALLIDGSSELFIGRQVSEIVDNIRLVGDKVNNPATEYKGTGLKLEALGDGNKNYISGVKINVDIEGFKVGHHEVTTGTGFINSNVITANINRCLKDSVIGSAIDKNQNTIQSNKYRFNIQPRTDTEFLIEAACSNSEFEGTAWDINSIADPSKAIRLVDEITDNGFFVNRGNTINMFGVSSDRIFGSLDTNTIITNNNKSNVKQPFANNDFGAKALFRKMKVGGHGDTDSFNYLQALDNYIAYADKRFLCTYSETNASGANIGSLTPTYGFVSNMYEANEGLCTFETLNYAQVTISFKEGDFPEDGIPTDLVGIKTLGVTPIRHIYIQVRYAGSSVWVDLTSDFDVSSSFFITRLEGLGGLNTVGTRSISGLRIRVNSYRSDISIENIFLMNPDYVGKEMLSPKSPVVFEGNMRMVSSDQGVIWVTPSGEQWKMVMKDGGVPAYELIT